jgi:hypothetical protein
LQQVAPAAHRSNPVVCRLRGYGPASLPTGGAAGAKPIDSLKTIARYIEAKKPKTLDEAEHMLDLISVIADETIREIEAEAPAKFDERIATFAEAIARSPTPPSEAFNDHRPGEIASPTPRLWPTPTFGHDAGLTPHLTLYGAYGVSFLRMQGGHQQHANKHKDCGCQRQKYCSHHVIWKNIDAHDFLLIAFLTPLTGAQLTSVQATRNRRSQGRNSGTFDPGG